MDRLTAMCALIALLIVGCGGESAPPAAAVSSSTTVAPSAATPAAARGGAGALGQTYQIDGSLIPPYTGGAPFRGTLHLTIIEAELRDAIAGSGTETIRPQGRYLVVYYEMKNDLNQEIGGGSLVNNRMQAVDGRGRSWSGNPGPGVEDAAARQHGYRQGEGHVAAGFSGRHAAVFDVPADARDLRVVIAAWGISVPLNLP